MLNNIYTNCISFFKRNRLSNYSIKKITSQAEVPDVSIFSPKNAVVEVIPEETKHVPLLPRTRLGMWNTGDIGHYNKLSGLEHLRHPSFNKGMCFSIQERMALGIHGLLPPIVMTQDEQVAHTKENLDSYNDNIYKNMFLMDLLERNEKLFYRLLSKYIKQLLPLLYMPESILACQKYDFMYRHPRGMFISINDKGHVYDVLKNWPENDVRAICVTDGERILGLGDLGAYGMGIPLVTLVLYTALAGIKPHYTLPIMLDVGTNDVALSNDPKYIGLKIRRVKGKEYDEFLDEFMDAVVRRFGQNCLVQFEDFGNLNAFRLLQKYRNDYCVFNDDIQGVGGVALAGLYGAMQITKRKISHNTFLFWGAGEANLGIANLCVMSMVQEGLTPEDAKKRIYMIDTKGLIVKNRPEGGITPYKAHFAHPVSPNKDLRDIIIKLKPNILIGAAAVPKVFTPEILQLMATINERPIIFALSNPTHKAECTAEECYTHTDGRGIYASGSPFDKVTYKGKTFHPRQGNNSFIFPGIALAITSVGMLTVPEEVFVRSAQALAKLLTRDNLEKGSLYPPVSIIQDVSVKIATAVAEYAYEIKKASLYPKPKNMEKFIRSQLYSTKYDRSGPCIYDFGTK